MFVQSNFGQKSTKSISLIIILTLLDKDKSQKFLLKRLNFKCRLNGIMNMRIECCELDNVELALTLLYVAMNRVIYI